MTSFVVSWLRLKLNVEVLRFSSGFDPFCVGLQGVAKIFSFSYQTVSEKDNFPVLLRHKSEISYKNHQSKQIKVH
jgi:hypothetical protein